MSDLISRQAAKEIACSLCRWEDTENCDECEHPIDDIPSAEPEIIRCRDCKFADGWCEGKYQGNPKFADGWCKGRHRGHPDWFCEYGERREDDV